MRTIALLSDFGLSDNYVAGMKGVILSLVPQVNMVDITHQVPRHDIRRGAFLLASSFAYFPRLTIFLAVVDPGVGSRRKAIALKTRNYYFVGPDNGLLSVAAVGDGVKKIVTLENKKYFSGDHVCRTFHGRDIFAPAAARIAKDEAFDSFGRVLRKFKRVNFGSPRVVRGVLTAEIIYEDKFGNLVTNISPKRFYGFTGGRRFVAWLNGKKIIHVSPSYAQSRRGVPFFVEGGFGFMEVSLREESALEYFSFKPGNKLIIEI